MTVDMDKFELASTQISNTESSKIKLSIAEKSILLLWRRVNASLSAYYKLIKNFGSAKLALSSAPSSWTNIKVHAKHVQRHQEANNEEDEFFIESIEKSIFNKEYRLLFHKNQQYPQQLLTLFDPPPVLFVRGNVNRLNQSQVAIVGSRKPTPSAQKFTFDMAQYLAKTGYIITSGLAQGVDAQAHMGALSQPQSSAGRTIGVMGTGIDVCYPKQHQALFERIIKEGGCIISELLPGTLPNKHTFPRRNRLVAGLSLGTIVTEAKIKSGSLITARLASEQGKQVFAMPSTVDNVNAEGCHHLIREGATLIYHPEQVVDDLSHQLVTPIERDILTQSSNIDTNNASHIELSKIEKIQTDNSIPSDFTENDTIEDKISSFISSDANKIVATLKQKKAIQNTAPPLNIPEHLQAVWSHIDFNGQDLDALVQKTQIETSTLLSQLMELELMGGLVQIGGHYKRV